MGDQPTGPTGQYQYQQPPAGPPPPYGYGYPAPRTDDLAVVSLVIAAAGFVTCPPLAAAGALVAAHRARERIAASGGRLTDGGLLPAARVLAYIQLGLTALVIVAIAVAVLVAGMLDAPPGSGFDPTMTSLRWLAGHALRVP